MRRMSLRVALTAAVLAAVLTGCAGTQTPAAVSSTAGSTLVQNAVVTDVRDIGVRGGGSSGVGSFFGGLLGGIAGSNVGSGYGRTAAAIGGAVAGSVAGQHVERTATTRMTQVTVRFPDRAVGTYEVSPEQTFRVGDTVKITTEHGVTRISR